MRRNMQMMLVLLAGAGLAFGQPPERVAEVLGDRGIDWKNPEARQRAVVRIREIENRRLQRAREIARRRGKPLREKLPSGKVRELIGLDEDGELLYVETRNTNAAISSGANLLHLAPYLTDGAGVKVGVWDADSVLHTHQEFNEGASSRVNLRNSDQPTDDHATHVAGTIAAYGVVSSAKGMVPAAEIESYDWTSDVSEMTAAGATAPGQFATKIYLSNHSYGFSYGWRYSSGWIWTGTGTDQNAYDPDFGQYSTTSANYDNMVYNAPYYAIFWAAGNENNDGPNNGNTVTIGGSSVTYNASIHPPNDGNYRNGFETIGDHGLAKNLVTVGAANDGVTSGQRDPNKATIASFSSTGPADDGRIKPDVVGNGVGLYSPIDTGISQYGSKSGTSMASPNVCGSAALLVALYRNLFSEGAMLASTLKGLLIHTASDIGNPGPDYTYGWGLIDVQAAADVIIDHHANPGKQRLTESLLSSSVPSRSYAFFSDGSPIRATLCWTDPAGAATSAHDLRTPVLVNDLHLKVIAPDGTEYLPYVMPFVGTWTVASMSQPATTGTNSVDNVEQVLIPIPGQSGTWHVQVSHAGTLTNGEQDFSLVLSGMMLDPDSVALTAPNGGEGWVVGTTETITWGSGMGGYVTLALLKGGDEHLTLAAETANDGSYAWTIPDSLVPGTDYRIRVTSVETPSATDTSDADFTILPSLGQAVDAPQLSWSTGGNQEWVPQTLTSQDGEDAAQSGGITHNQTSDLETTLTGPGTLTFWWKVSSESNYDFLRFSLDDVEQGGALARISGLVDWEQKTVDIPEGDHTVRWRYTKDGSVDTNADAGWLDGVVFTPSGGSLAVTPVEDLAATGIEGGPFAPDSLTYTLANSGSSPLDWTAAITSAWLTLSASSGTLAAGTSTTVTVSMHSNANGLGVGAYHDTVVFSNTTNGNGSDTRDVFLTVLEPIQAPSGLGATPLSPWQIDLSWTDNSDTETGFAIERSLTSSSGFLQIGSAAEDVTTYADPGVVPGVTYYYRVIATNAVTRSAASAEAVQTTPKAPAAVALNHLLQTYDGTARTVSYTLDTPGLTVDLTYDGNAWAPTNAGSYAVLATIVDDTYQGSTNGTLIVAKANPTVLEWPTASQILLGDPLSASELSGGSASQIGVFAFSAPETVPAADGTYAASVIFTPTDTANYSTVSGSVGVEVAWPELGYVSVSPANGYQHVPHDTDLVIVFNQPVFKGTGGLEIRAVAGDGLVQEIDVTTDAVSIHEATVAITIGELAGLTEYYVLIQAGMFKNAAEAAFAGITDVTEWHFRTRDSLFEPDGSVIRFR